MEKEGKEGSGLPDKYRIGYQWASTIGPEKTLNLSDAKLY